MSVDDDTKIKKTSIITLQLMGDEYLDIKTLINNREKSRHSARIAADKVKQERLKKDIADGYKPRIRNSGRSKAIVPSLSRVIEFQPGIDSDPIISTISMSINEKITVESNAKTPAQSSDGESSSASTPV